MLAEMMLQEVSKLTNLLHGMRNEGNLDLIRACCVLEVDVICE